MFIICIFVPTCPKKLGHHETPNSKMGKPFGNVGTHSFTLVEVCLSLMIFFQPIVHALVLVTSLRLGSQQLCTINQK
jgi:hypothetical protein